MPEAVGDGKAVRAADRMPEAAKDVRAVRAVDRMLPAAMGVRAVRVDKVAAGWPTSRTKIARRCAT